MLEGRKFELSAGGVNHQLSRFLYMNMHACMHAYVCVCVRERERERERAGI